jgi:hypothetical protein
LQVKFFGRNGLHRGGLRVLERVVELFFHYEKSGIGNYSFYPQPTPRRGYNISTSVIATPWRGLGVVEESALSINCIEQKFKE